MTSELEPGIQDKLMMLKERHFPFVEKSELVQATYEVPNLGPWDFNMKGMPKFGKIAAVVFLTALFCAAVYAISRFGVLSAFYMERLIAVGIVLGFLCIGAGMWIFISLNWGTFSRYKRVIDYVWRYMDRRPVRKGEFRVKKITQIWPLGKERLERKAEEMTKEIYVERIAVERQLIALPGIGSKRELLFKEKGFETVSAVALAQPEQLTEIKGINADLADILIGAARQLIKDDLQAAEDDKDDAAAALALPPDVDDLLDDEEEIEKLSSTHRLDRMVKKIKGVTMSPEARDAVKTAINLKFEFIRIVQGLDSQFTYSIMECEGPLYILVISRFSLTGGDDEEKRSGFVEFRDHSLTQRTYIYQGLNERATWGVFTHLADYKYLEIPSTDLMLAGKEERVKYAPIAFLNYSDGQAEMDDEQIRKDRWTPKGTDVLQAELVYGASVAEKGLETIKLLTSTVSRLKATISEIWREAQDWAKGVIAKAVEKIMLEERLRREPGLKTWLVNVFSSKGMRYFMYAVGVLGIYVLAAYAIGVIFPNVQLWPWGGGEPTGGDGTTPDPYDPGGP